MKTIIECNCLDQNLIIKNKPTIASGGANEDVIIFNFCDKWKDLKKTAIFFNTKNDIYKQELDAENKCFIPEMTLAKAGKLYIGVYGEKECERRTSSIVSLDIQQGATVSGENLIDKAKKEQRETDRTELAGVVTELTGEDYSTSEWDRLMGVTAELPIKSEQDIVDLRDCRDLKYAFERCTTLPSILLDTYNLETDEETAEEKYIRLPYLNTKNMVFNIWSPKPSVFKVSKSIVECGFDVSACKTISATQNSPFVNANYLQRTKLTGIRSLDRMWYMFYNAVGLVEVELGDSGTAPETVNSLYWQAAFSGCTSLQAITGDPLDMSRGDYYSNADNKAETRTFYNCKDLRHVRFKPGTICHDLDLSYCTALIKKYESTTDNPGTLLSIINGVRDYTGEEDPITIYFSTFVKSYLSSWRCTIDEQTGLYVYSDKNSDFTMWSVLTNLKGVVIS